MWGRGGEAVNSKSSEIDKIEHRNYRITVKLGVKQLDKLKLIRANLKNAMISPLTDTYCRSFFASMRINKRIRLWCFGGGKSCAAVKTISVLLFCALYYCKNKESYNGKTWSFTRMRSENMNRNKSESARGRKRSKNNAGSDKNKNRQWQNMKQRVVINRSKSCLFINNEYTRFQQLLFRAAIHFRILYNLSL